MNLNIECEKNPKENVNGEKYEELSDNSLVELAKKRTPITLPYREDFCPAWATNQIEIVSKVWMYKGEIHIKYKRFFVTIFYRRSVIDREQLIKILKQENLRENSF